MTTTANSDIIGLNVGGVIYTTTRLTLRGDPDSMLATMFRGDLPSTRDSSGNYFIDRDGKLFRYVLNFLRSSQLNLPEGFKEIAQLRDEADFYQIKPLISEIDKIIGDDTITLNVGGILYTASRSTLTRDPDSELAAILKDGITAPRDSNGNCYIDRDGKLFRYVLNFLRSSQLILPEDFKEIKQLKSEADFYNIKDFISHIEEWENILLGNPKSGVVIEIHDHMSIKEHARAREVGNVFFTRGTKYTKMRILVNEKYMSIPPLNEIALWEQAFNRHSTIKIGDVRNEGETVSSVSEFRSKLKLFGWEKVRSMSFPLVSEGSTAGFQIVEKWFKAWNMAEASHV